PGERGSGSPAISAQHVDLGDRSEREHLHRILVQPPEVALRSAQRLLEVTLLEEQEHHIAVVARPGEAVAVPIVDLHQLLEVASCTREISAPRPAIAVETEVAGGVPGPSIPEVLLDQLGGDGVFVAPVADEVMVDELGLAVDEVVSDVPFPDQGAGNLEHPLAEREGDARVREDPGARDVVATCVIDLPGIGAVEPAQAGGHRLQEEALRVTRDLGPPAVEEELAHRARVVEVLYRPVAPRPEIEVIEDRGHVEDKACADCETTARHTLAQMRKGAVEVPDRLQELARVE